MDVNLIVDPRIENDIPFFETVIYKIMEQLEFEPIDRRSLFTIQDQLERCASILKSHCVVRVDTYNRHGLDIHIGVANTVPVEMMPIARFAKNNTNELG